MIPAIAVKDDKSLDDFLKGIMFADLDVQLIEDADELMLYESDAMTPNDEDDTTTAVFGGAIVIEDPVDSPRSETSSSAPPPRQQGHPVSSGGRTPTVARRRRDRRRNQTQRERENAKRKVKQAEFLNMRTECFGAESELRRYVCCIIANLARDHGVSMELATSMVPAELRGIMDRAEAAKLQYRGFTGQKHICMKLNRFPAWSAAGEPTMKR